MSKKDIDNRIPAAAYCRVSTGSEEQVNSLNNQIEYFKEFFEVNNKYKAFTPELKDAIYADEGLSGTKLQRDAFEKLLYDAGLDIVKVETARTEKSRYTKAKFITQISDRKPKFKWIFVKDTSRLARNVLLSVILTELRDLGVYVYFIEIDKSTEREDDLQILNLLLTLDEFSSRDTSRKVRYSNKKLKERGGMIVSSRIYGYDVSARTKESPQIMTINEEQAQVVRLAFELYLDGYGYRRITNTLNEDYFWLIHEDGTKTIIEKSEKTDDMQTTSILSNSGKPWNQGSIQKMLHNEKYAGYNNFMKYDSGVVLVNKKVSATVREGYESEMLYQPDKVPPIIDMETWEKCLALRKGKKTHFHKDGELVFDTSSKKLTGKIQCSVCGARYIHNKDTDTGKGYFNCWTKKKLGKKNCDSINVYDDDIYAYLDELANPDAFGNINDTIETEYMYIIHALFYKLDEVIERLTTPEELEKIASVTERLRVEEEIIKKLALTMATATSPAVQKALEDNLTEKGNEIDEIRKELYTLVKEPNDLLEEYQKILKVIDEIVYKHAYKKRTYTRDEIIRMVSKIIVGQEAPYAGGKLKRNKPFFRVFLNNLHDVSSIVEYNPDDTEKHTKYAFHWTFGKFNDFDDNRRESIEYYKSEYEKLYAEYHIE